MNLEDLINKITEFKNSLNEDNSLMVSAEELGNEQLRLVADLIHQLRTACDSCVENLLQNNISNKINHKTAEINSDTFNVMVTLAKMAEELDKTKDPILMKEASVLDEILLTFGRPQGSIEAIKQAEETEIDRLRAKYREQAREDLYQKPKEKMDQDLKVADSLKVIKDNIKEYRPLEASLSTRTCPDHPGAQMARIGDYIYQCSLDKQIYNYQNGFRTMKGNIVPGGDVAGQTQFLNDHAVSHSQFDTRESKLNS